MFTLLIMVMINMLGRLASAPLTLDSSFRPRQLSLCSFSDFQCFTFKLWLQVKAIVKPDRYMGPDQLYALDIGLIVLTKSVEVNTRVMPACIDWSANSKPSNNEKGVVWVYTTLYK